MPKLGDALCTAMTFNEAVPRRPSNDSISPLLKVSVKTAVGVLK